MKPIAFIFEKSKKDFVDFRVKLLSALKDRERGMRGRGMKERGGTVRAEGMLIICTRTSLLSAHRSGVWAHATVPIIMVLHVDDVVRRRRRRLLRRRRKGGEDDEGISHGGCCCSVIFSPFHATYAVASQRLQREKRWGVITSSRPS